MSRDCFVRLIAKAHLLRDDLGVIRRGDWFLANESEAEGLVNAGMAELPTTGERKRGHHDKAKP